MDSHDSGLCWTDQSPQRTKLIGNRRAGPVGRELALANHVHELYPLAHWRHCETT